jgi:LacI family transcriptional regulator
LLKNGKIDFLICQKPEAQGFTAINLLFDHLIKKELVMVENYISIDIITAENLDYYSSF